MDNPIWSCFFRPSQDKKANIELLRDVPVFEGLTNGELVQIERVLYERRYAKGDMVFNEDEPGAGMYIVKKGSVSISMKIDGKGRMDLARIQERSFFGELALLDEIPRSASAVSLSETVLFGFSKPDLENLLDRNSRLGIKILTNLSRLVCKRLIKSNDNLEVLQSELTKLRAQVSEPGKKAHV
jgi:CRP-like cAMP-binding protein